MTGLTLIRAALETALAAMSGNLATAWENVPYTPVPGTPYQRVYLLPVEPDNPTIGRFTTEKGVFQVSLYYPLDTGSAAAAARAELIRDTFYRGASFTSGGLTTIIERTPEIAPALTLDDRFVVPVRVRFYAHREI
ncbi:MAG: phage tail terminator-like protein [Cypionkella sp.]